MKPLDDEIDTLLLIFAKQLRAIDYNRVKKTITQEQEAIDRAEFHHYTKQAINRLIVEAKIGQIDELIDLELDKQFLHWRQQDIANFFNRVGRIRRKLEATLTKRGE